MNKLGAMAKQIPLLPSLYRWLRDKEETLRFRGKPLETVFRDIYVNNHWNNSESVSGPGSTLAETAAVIETMDVLIKELKLRSLLDIPCGDFNWMSQVDLADLSYVGGDIVQELVLRNQELYSREGLTFMQLDLISSTLPTTDAILCRDCLVHLSYDLIWSAIQNIRRSGSKLLIATTFPKLDHNRDIITGKWRPLNLQLPPFNFPIPLRTISEKNETADGGPGDKSLAVWSVSDLPTSAS
jgi:hypothetical protein